MPFLADRLEAMGVALTAVTEVAAAVVTAVLLAVIG
jgi:hypothetical protein